MGPRQDVGKAKRPMGRAKTGAHPGGVHGGSAGLVEMAACEAARGLK
jgi:hypothetical protein